MADVFLSLFSNVCTFIAVVAAAKLGLRQFYLEKKWERRAIAYSAVLDALHHMSRYYTFEEENLGREYGGSEEARATRERFYEKRRAELGQREEVAYAEVQRWRDIGAIDISAEAIAALDALETAFETGRNTSDWNHHITEASGGVGVCLQKMKLIAQRDLQPSLGWPDSLWGGLFKSRR